MRILVASVAMLVAACGFSAPIPADAQMVHLSRVDGHLVIEPRIARPGLTYLVIDEPLTGAEFIHRSADMDDPQSPPLPISDADIESLEFQDTFMGAVMVGLSVHDRRDFRLGALVAGKYAFMNTGELAILEVAE